MAWLNTDAERALSLEELMENSADVSDLVVGSPEALRYAELRACNRSVVDLHQGRRAAWLSKQGLLIREGQHTAKLRKGVMDEEARG